MAFKIRAVANFAVEQAAARAAQEEEERRVQEEEEQAERDLDGLRYWIDLWNSPVLEEHQKRRHRAERERRRDRERELRERRMPKMTAMDLQEITADLRPPHLRDSTMPGAVDRRHVLPPPMFDAEGNLIDPEAERERREAAAAAAAAAVDPLAKSYKSLASFGQLSRPGTAPEVESGEPGELEGGAGLGGANDDVDTTMGTVLRPFTSGDELRLFDQWAGRPREDILPERALEYKLKELRVRPVTAPGELSRGSAVHNRFPFPEVANSMARRDQVKGGFTFIRLKNMRDHQPDYEDFPRLMRDNTADEARKARKAFLRTNTAFVDALDTSCVYIPMSFMGGEKGEKDRSVDALLRAARTAGGRDEQQYTWDDGELKLAAQRTLLPVERERRKGVREPEPLVSYWKNEHIRVNVDARKQLTRQLQKRREVRETAYESKAVLSKVADIVLQPPAQVELVHQRKTENLWGTARQKLAKDPSALPTRQAFYSQLQQYVQDLGGLRTAADESLVQAIRSRMQRGYPITGRLVFDLIREFGPSSITDPDLAYITSFVARACGVSATQLVRFLNSQGWNMEFHVVPADGLPVGTKPILSRDRDQRDRGDKSSVANTTAMMSGEWD